MRRFSALDADGPRNALNMRASVPTPPKMMSQKSILAFASRFGEQERGFPLELPTCYAAFALGLDSIDFRLSTRDLAGAAESLA